MASPEPDKDRTTHPYLVSCFRSEEAIFELHHPPDNWIMVMRAPGHDDVGWRLSDAELEGIQRMIEEGRSDE